MNPWIVIAIIGGGWMFASAFLLVTACMFSARLSENDLGGLMELNSHSRKIVRTNMLAQVKPTLIPDK